MSKQQEQDTKDCHAVLGRYWARNLQHISREEAEAITRILNSAQELCAQRDAALKLAGDFDSYSESASKLGLTGAASAFCQCAKELRLALAPKE